MRWMRLFIAHKVILMSAFLSIVLLLNRFQRNGSELPIGYLIEAGNQA